MPPPGPLPKVLPCPICRRGMLQWSQVHLVPQPGRNREQVDVACSDTNGAAKFDWVRGAWEVPDTLELKSCTDSQAVKTNVGPRILKDWFPPGTQGEIVPAGSAPVATGWPPAQALAILLFAGLLLFGHFIQEMSWGGALVLSLVATGIVALLYAGLRAAVRAGGSETASPDAPANAPPTPQPPGPRPPDVPA